MGDQVEVLRKENNELKKQVADIMNDLKSLKHGAAAKRRVKQHGAVASQEPVATAKSGEPPNANDVQYLSDSYDELLVARNDTEEKLASIESRLQLVSDKVSEISKAIDDIQLYSYQYNLKIVGVPQEDGTETAEKTAKLCMKIFAGIGANVAEFDIDTAHRVPARNSRRKQASTQSTYQPIICKFTRRIARDGVLAKRREIRRLTPEIFGLPTGTDLRISIYCHLIPRLQELLHSAKTFQEENSFKYCWAKDAAVFLRKTENSRIFKLSRLEDLEELRCNATSPTATEIR